MADTTEEPRLESEDEGGGPVKSFLEHLEDLRWVIIKCGAATVLGMVICLLAVDKLVTILKWPLERSRLLHKISAPQQVLLYWGTNRWAVFESPTNRVGALYLGTNRSITYQVEPIAVGTNYLLGLRCVTNSPNAVAVGKGPDLIYLDPAAPFISSLHLAFFGGLLLASPFVFFFLAQFIVPALKLKERNYFGKALYFGVGLFLTGVCFCYFLLMPLALRAAEAYSLWMGVAMPDWRAETYFSFVTKFMLGMGLGFEMPVVLLALVKIGLLDYRKLAAFRRYMIVINLVLGAVLTTPEVLTQVLMFVPLQILYEVSIWIAWYWERQEKKKSQAGE